MVSNKLDGNPSLNLFMSTLMSECKNRNQGALPCSDHDDQKELSIDIVEDRAKSYCPSERGVVRMNSLVPMRPQRSGRQLSRWSNEFESLDSSPRLLTRTKVGTKDATIDRRGMFQRASSDSSVLVPPKRHASPTRMRGGQPFRRA